MNFQREGNFTSRHEITNPICHRLPNFTTQKKGLVNAPKTSSTTSTPKFEKSKYMKPILTVPLFLSKRVTTTTSAPTTTFEKTKYMKRVFSFPLYNSKKSY